MSLPSYTAVWGSHFAVGVDEARLAAVFACHAVGARKVLRAAGWHLLWEAASFFPTVQTKVCGVRSVCYLPTPYCTVAMAVRVCHTEKQPPARPRSRARVDHVLRQYLGFTEYPSMFLICVYSTA